MSTAGTILKVDLTGGKIEKKPTAPYVKDYIGGTGIAARIFWEEVPPGTRAFSPENALIFSAGTLTGTLLGNKGEVCSKTPEQANHPYVHIGFGGQFPCEMKFAGYDQIVIKGKAKELSYLYIDNDRVEVRDGRHLKGLDVHETQRRIKQELGDPDIQVACIGPAGENLVVCAMVVNDIGNSASKRGMGAVMGSKNLKAVAVRGTKGVKIADPKAFLTLYNKFYHDLTRGQAWPYARLWHEEGMSRMHSEGYSFIGHKELLPEKVPYSPTREFMKKYVINYTGCAFCPLQCHQNLSVPSAGNGEAMCVAWWGLLYALMYEKKDYNLWWKRTVLCEKYGVDHLYVEMLGSWLMELYKNGVITAADTDGIPMVKGSEEAVVALIEKLAKAEGFGKLLADGIVPAAQKLGRNSLDYADQIGNSPPYLAPGLGVLFNEYLGPAAKYRPGDFEGSAPLPLDAYAAAPSLAEILGISPREAADWTDGHCSYESEKITGDKDFWKTDKYDEKERIMIAYQEDSNCLGDIVGHCHYLSDWYPFAGMHAGIEEYAQWLAAATGIDYTVAELRNIAHRVRMIIDSYRVLCFRAIGEEHVHSKRSASIISSLSAPGLGYPGGPEAREKRVEDFCQMRGYDPKTGIPTREMLEKLGLKDVADKLDETMGAVTKPEEAGET